MTPPPPPVVLGHRDSSSHELFSSWVVVSGVVISGIVVSGVVVSGVVVLTQCRLSINVSSTNEHSGFTKNFPFFHVSFRIKIQFNCIPRLTIAVPSVTLSIQPVGFVL